MRRVVPLAAAACLAAVTAVASASAAGPGEDPLSFQLPWLHVAAGGGGLPQIADPAGRTVLLRGVNIVGLEDDFYRNPDGSPAGARPFWPTAASAYAGRCPENSVRSGEAPVCELDAAKPAWKQSGAAGSRNDFAQMRALGFNVVRLPVSWSQLEPAPGTYNRTYIDRIAQVVGWAKQQGIYTVIDMHEDSYSRFTPEGGALAVPGVVGPSRNETNHADGAPPWAVMASGVPGATLIGTAELDTYVEAAFTSFWLNRTPTDAQGSPVRQGEAPGVGLQDHYIGAMAALAKRFRDEPAVAGYEIMNEPLPGFIPPPAAEQGFLFPFYTRVVSALTGVADLGGYRDLGIHDTRHLFFYEPYVIRNLTDVATGVSRPFTSYPNVVYAPHVYTHVFTVERQAPAPLNDALGAVFPVGGYSQAMETAALEATAMRSALFIGEYGNSSSQDDQLLAPQSAVLDEHHVSATLWQWKGNCSPGQSAAQCKGLWSMFNGGTGAHPAHDAGLIASRVKYVSRAYARAVNGTVLQSAYDPSNRTYRLVATGAHGSHSHGQDTVVFVPREATGAVRVQGAAAQTVRTPDGARLVYVRPSEGASYLVTIG